MRLLRHRLGLLRCAKRHACVVATGDKRGARLSPVKAVPRMSRRILRQEATERRTEHPNLTSDVRPVARGLELVR